MKHCRKCGVYVSDDEAQCPLCFSELGAAKGDTEVSCYPVIPERPREFSLLYRLFVFLTVAVGLFSFSVNLYFWNGILWALIVMTGMLLVWETVALMILSKKNVGLKLIAQAFALLTLLITIDAVTGWNQWSIGIAAPFVIVASTAVMTAVLCLKRTQWQRYILFQFLLTVNGFIPVILYGCGLTKFILPGIAGALYSLLTLVGIFIFADKQVKNELKKRLHI